MTNYLEKIIMDMKFGPFVPSFWCSKRLAAISAWRSSNPGTGGGAHDEMRAPGMMGGALMASTAFIVPVAPMESVALRASFETLAQWIWRNWSCPSASVYWTTDPSWSFEVGGWGGSCDAKVVDWEADDDIDGVGGLSLSLWLLLATSSSSSSSSSSPPP